MPPFAYFAAKIAVSIGFSSIVVLLLTLLGFLFGGVHMAPLSVIKLIIGTLVAGCIPFCALGLVIGYFAGPNSAPATINLIYLPMSFCSGLWIPYLFLPEVRAADRAGDAVLPLVAIRSWRCWRWTTQGSRRYGTGELCSHSPCFCLAAARVGFQAG